MTPREPGWYRDPDDPKSHRYWDGYEWVRSRDSQPGSSPGPEPSPSPETE